MQRNPLCRAFIQTEAIMQENMDNIIRVFDFVKEIDKMKTVLRRSLIYDGSKREDDAEHSWHLAMMAILLKSMRRFRSIWKNSQDDACP